MSILRRAAAGTALIIIGGCADGRTVLDPAPAISGQGHSSDVPTRRARQVPASGHFDAIVNFSTLSLTPRGRNCVLQVKGQLVFTGTLAGAATGTTTALVLAPCSDVATTPPGTFRDVFRSELTFEGTVNGEPARANVIYMGGVQPGGQIEGRLLFSDGVRGTLDVQARVAVGGEYSGSVAIR